MKHIIFGLAFSSLLLLTYAQSQEKILCGMTPELRQKLVDAHNDYRNKVANGSETNQPGAVDMQAMTYNMTLEFKASGWASTCPSGLNPDPKDANRQYVGENIYFEWNSTNLTSFDPELGVTAVAAWYSEVKDFTPDMIKPFQNNLKTANYSQVVWASSTSFGCGVALCYYPRAKLYKTVLICNYWPAGNWDAGTMYTEATGAPGCSSTPNTVYTALCGNPKLSAPTGPGSCKFKSLIPTAPKWVEQNLATWKKKNAKLLRIILETLKGELRGDGKYAKFDILFVFVKGVYTQLVINIYVKGKLTDQAFVIVSYNSGSYSTKNPILTKAQAKAKAMSN